MGESNRLEEDKKGFWKKKKNDMESGTPYTKETLATQIIMTVFAILFIAPIVIILNWTALCR